MRALSVERLTQVCAVVLFTAAASAAPVPAAATAAPDTAPGWAAMMAAIPGWGAADGLGSTLLPDGRVVFGTGDTVVDGQFRHNSLIVADGGTAHVVVQPAPDDPDGAQHWTVQTVVDGGRLYATAAHVHEQSGGVWQQIGTDLAEYTLPAGADPAFSRYLLTPSSARSSDRQVQWGSAYTRSGWWVYVWGQADPGDAYGARDAYLARARAGHLADTAHWTYWTGSAWTWDETAAQPVLTAHRDGGTDSGYTVWRRPDGTWTLLTKRGGVFSSDLGAFTARSPAGPWAWRHLADMPWTTDQSTYLAMAHPWARLASGRLLVCVSVGHPARTDPWNVFTHSEDYRPIWLEVA